MRHKNIVEFPSRFLLALADFPLPSGGSAQTDPIYAAIEAHRKAYRLFAEAVSAKSPLPPGDPGWAEAEQATGRAWENCADAAAALASVQPTTLAGVMALLDYVDAFNHGAIKHRSCDSSHLAWPHRTAEDDPPVGAPTGLPWPFLVMNNIRAALAKIEPADEIVRLQAAKRGALAIADERSKENVELRAALAKLTRA